MVNRKIKRIITILVAASMLFGLTGCQQVIELMDSATESISGDTINGNFYRDLASMMSSPERLYNDSSYSGYVEKNITFTALVLSEPEILEFDEEEGGPRSYISATISRNENKIMLIDVEDLDAVPGPGEIVDVNGYVNGYIYYVVDNQNVSQLDIKARKITAREPEYNPVTENEIVFKEYLANGTIMFRHAELTKNSFDREVLLLYFDFTNSGNIDNTSPIDRITFYQGDTYLKTTGSSVENGVDPQALTHNVLNAAKPGKTSFYYVVLEAEDKEMELTADPVTAYFYDDDYNCLYEVEISVQ